MSKGIVIDITPPDEITKQKVEATIQIGKSYMETPAGKFVSKVLPADPKNKFIKTERDQNFVLGLGLMMLEPAFGKQTKTGSIFTTIGRAKK